MNKTNLIKKIKSFLIDLFYNADFDEYRKDKGGLWCLIKLQGSGDYYIWFNNYSISDLQDFGYIIICIDDYIKDSGYRENYIK